MSIQKMATWCAGTLMFFAICSTAQHLLDTPDRSDFKKTSEISYGVVDGHDLKLDLYLPTDAANPPLLIWVHGGAWRRGSKERVLTTAFVEDGYAMASLDYRLSGVAMFPAQIHDIKAAIRFLRGNASTFGYDATQVGILGSSAGGHLAALVGVTNGHDELEGEVGDYLQQSSNVQAIVSYFGASNLTAACRSSSAAGMAG